MIILPDTFPFTWGKSSPSSPWKVSVFVVILVRIQSECGKIRTRITPNTDSFQAVFVYLYSTLGSLGQRTNIRRMNQPFINLSILLKTIYWQLGNLLLQEFMLRWFMIKCSGYVSSYLLCVKLLSLSESEDFIRKEPLKLLLSKLKCSMDDSVPFFLELAFLFFFLSWFLILNLLTFFEGICFTATLIRQTEFAKSIKNFLAVSLFQKTQK